MSLGPTGRLQPIQPIPLTPKAFHATIRWHEQRTPQPWLGSTSVMMGQSLSFPRASTATQQVPRSHLQQKGLTPWTPFTPPTLRASASTG
jgi:hypothetical protein